MIYKLLLVLCFIIQCIQGQGPLVTLQVYYETYDFDSRIFIATELKETVDLLISQYFAVELYAYGNAKSEAVDGKYEFTCENGPEECVGNKFDACALDILDFKTALALINCVIDPFTGLNGEYKIPSYTKCWYNLDVNTTEIHECSVSERGEELLRMNGEATGLVDPKHLPLVLINGVEWNTDDDVSLFVAVCEALVELGLIRPANCF